jgi:predicted component of type VI protein secretion system
MPFLELDGAPPHELGTETTVGSGSQAALRLQNKDLAARHFTVRVASDGGARVVPASPQNVVILNGEQVPASGAPLNGGDVIGAGAARFVFLVTPGAPRPATGPVEQKAHLIDASGRKGYPLRKRVVQIGREIGCNIVLRDPSVSRFHADVRSEGGEYVLYSVGASGTRINGHPARAPQMLREGDQIEIGHTTLSFSKAALPPGIKVVELEEHRDTSFSRKGTQVMRRIGGVDAKEFSPSRSLSPLLLGAAAVIIALLAVIAFK